MQSLRYLRHCGTEWSGKERCEGKVRWKEVGIEEERQWRLECRMEIGVESVVQSVFGEVV